MDYQQARDYFRNFINWCRGNSGRFTKYYCHVVISEHDDGTFYTCLSVGCKLDDCGEIAYLIPVDSIECCQQHLNDLIHLTSVWRDYNEVRKFFNLFALNIENNIKRLQKT